jgi:hypothetical protein
LSGRVVTELSPTGKITFLTLSNQRIEVPASSVTPVRPAANDQYILMADPSARGRVETVESGTSMALCKEADGGVALSPLNELVKFTER